MYLEKEALDYFRKYDTLKYFLAFPFLNLSGEIPSRRLGQNLEFEQYREYIPGDEIRNLDWKVLARSGKAFIKNYGSDINTSVSIILDNSLSMDFPQNHDSKLEVSKKIIAILSYLLLKKKNKVSLGIINENYQEMGSIQYNNLERLLSRIKAQNKTNPLNIPSRANKEITFLISDGWWKSTELKDILSHLIVNQIHLIHILSPEEIELNWSGYFELIDSESNKKLNIIPSEIRDSYQKKIKERITLFRQTLTEKKILYGTFPLNIPYYVNLRNFMDLLIHRIKIKRNIT